MTDAQDKEQALDKLSVLVQAEVEPTLTETELEEILDRNKLASRWLPSTPLGYGDVVLPATRNGLVYRVVIAGTTGATEPSWPTDSDSGLVDDTVTFQEFGSDYASVYNLRAATQEAWLLKAAKASELVSSSVSGSEQQIFDHCEAMAQAYRSVLIA